MDWTSDVKDSGFSSALLDTARSKELPASQSLQSGVSEQSDALDNTLDSRLNSNLTAEEKRSSFSAGIKDGMEEARSAFLEDDLDKRFQDAFLGNYIPASKASDPFSSQLTAVKEATNASETLAENVEALNNPFYDSNPFQDFETHDSSAAQGSTTASVAEFGYPSEKNIPASNSYKSGNEQEKPLASENHQFPVGEEKQSEMAECVHKDTIGVDTSRQDSLNANPFSSNNANTKTDVTMDSPAAELVWSGAALDQRDRTLHSGEFDTDQSPTKTQIEGEDRRSENLSGDEAEGWNGALSSTGQELSLTNPFMSGDFDTHIDATKGSPENESVWSSTSHTQDDALTPSREFYSKDLPAETELINENDEKGRRKSDRSVEKQAGVFDATKQDPSITNPFSADDFSTEVDMTKSGPTDVLDLSEKLYAQDDRNPSSQFQYEHSNDITGLKSETSDAELRTAFKESNDIAEPTTLENVDKSSVPNNNSSSDPPLPQGDRATVDQTNTEPPFYRSKSSGDIERPDDASNEQLSADVGGTTSSDHPLDVFVSQSTDVDDSHSSPPDADALTTKSGYGEEHVRSAVGSSSTETSSKNAHAETQQTVVDEDSIDLGVEVYKGKAQTGNEAAAGFDEFDSPNGFHSKGNLQITDKVVSDLESLDVPRGLSDALFPNQVNSDITKFYTQVESENSILQSKNEKLSEMFPSEKFRPEEHKRDNLGDPVKTGEGTEQADYLNKGARRAESDDGHRQALRTGDNDEMPETSGTRLERATSTGDSEEVDTASISVENEAFPSRTDAEGDIQKVPLTATQDAEAKSVNEETAQTFSNDPLLTDPKELILQEDEDVDSRKSKIQDVEKQSAKENLEGGSIPQMDATLLPDEQGFNATMDMSSTGSQGDDAGAPTAPDSSKTNPMLIENKTQSQIQEPKPFNEGSHPDDKMSQNKALDLSDEVGRPSEIANERSGIPDSGLEKSSESKIPEDRQTTIFPVEPQESFEKGSGDVQAEAVTIDYHSSPLQDGKDESRDSLQDEDQNFTQEVHIVTKEALDVDANKFIVDKIEGELETQDPPNDLASHTQDCPSSTSRDEVTRESNPTNIQGHVLINNDDEMDIDSVRSPFGDLDHNQISETERADPSVNITADSELLSSDADDLRTMVKGTEDSKAEQALTNVGNAELIPETQQTSDQVWRVEELDGDEFSISTETSDGKVNGSEVHSILGKNTEHSFPFPEKSDFASNLKTDTNEASLTTQGKEKKDMEEVIEEERKKILDADPAKVDSQFGRDSVRSNVDGKLLGDIATEEHANGSHTDVYGSTPCLDEQPPHSAAELSGDLALTANLPVDKKNKQHREDYTEEQVPMENAKTIHGYPAQIEHKASDEPTGDCKDNTLSNRDETSSINEDQTVGDPKLRTEVVESNVTEESPPINDDSKHAPAKEASVKEITLVDSIEEEAVSPLVYDQDLAIQSGHGDPVQSVPKADVADVANFPQKQADNQETGAKVQEHLEEALEEKVDFSETSMKAKNEERGDQIAVDKVPVQHPAFGTHIGLKDLSKTISDDEEQDNTKDNLKDSEFLPHVIQDKVASQKFATEEPVNKVSVGSVFASALSDGVEEFVSTENVKDDFRASPTFDPTEFTQKFNVSQTDPGIISTDTLHGPLDHHMGPKYSDSLPTDLGQSISEGNAKQPLQDEFIESAGFDNAFAEDEEMPQDGGVTAQLEDIGDIPATADASVAVSQGISVKAGDLMDQVQVDENLEDLPGSGSKQRVELPDDDSVDGTTAFSLEGDHDEDIIPVNIVSEETLSKLHEEGVQSSTSTKNDEHVSSSDMVEADRRKLSLSDSSGFEVQPSSVDNKVELTLADEPNPNQEQYGYQEQTDPLQEESLGTNVQAVVANSAQVDNAELETTSAYPLSKEENEFDLRTNELALPDPTRQDNETVMKQSLDTLELEHIKDEELDDISNLKQDEKQQTKLEHMDFDKGVLSSNSSETVNVVASVKESISTPSASALQTTWESSNDDVLHGTPKEDACLSLDEDVKNGEAAQPLNMSEPSTKSDDDGTLRQPSETGSLDYSVPDHLEGLKHDGPSQIKSIQEGTVETSINRPKTDIQDAEASNKLLQPEGSETLTQRDSQLEILTFDHGDDDDAEKQFLDRLSSKPFNMDIEIAATQPSGESDTFEPYQEDDYDAKGKNSGKISDSPLKTDIENVAIQSFSQLDNLGSHQEENDGSMKQTSDQLSSNPLKTDIEKAVIQFDSELDNLEPDHKDYDDVMKQKSDKLSGDPLKTDFEKEFSESMSELNNSESDREGDDAAAKQKSDKMSNNLLQTDVEKSATRSVSELGNLESDHEDNDDATKPSPDNLLTSTSLRADIEKTATQPIIELENTESYHEDNDDVMEQDSNEISSSPSDRDIEKVATQPGSELDHPELDHEDYDDAAAQRVYKLRSNSLKTDIDKLATQSDDELDNVESDHENDVDTTKQNSDKMSSNALKTDIQKTTIGSNSELDYPEFHPENNDDATNQNPDNLSSTPLKADVEKAAAEPVSELNNPGSQHDDDSDVANENVDKTSSSPLKTEVEGVVPQRSVLANSEPIGTDAESLGIEQGAVALGRKYEVTEAEDADVLKPHSDAVDHSQFQPNVDVQSTYDGEQKDESLQELIAHSIDDTSGHHDQTDDIHSTAIPSESNLEPYLDDSIIVSEMPKDFISHEGDVQDGRTTQNVNSSAEFDNSEAKHMAPSHSDVQTPALGKQESKKNDTSSPSFASVGEPMELGIATTIVDAVSSLDDEQQPPETHASSEDTEFKNDEDLMTSELGESDKRAEDIQHSIPTLETVAEKLDWKLHDEELHSDALKDAHLPDNNMEHTLSQQSDAVDVILKPNSDETHGELSQSDDLKHIIEHPADQEHSDSSNMETVKGGVTEMKYTEREIDIDTFETKGTHLQNEVEETIVQFSRDLVLAKPTPGDDDETIVKQHLADNEPLKTEVEDESALKRIPDQFDFERPPSNIAEKSSDDRSEMVSSGEIGADLYSDHMSRYQLYHPDDTVIPSHDQAERPRDSEEEETYLEDADSKDSGNVVAAPTSDVDEMGGDIEDGITKSDVVFDELVRKTSTEETCSEVLKDGNDLVEQGIEIERATLQSPDIIDCTQKQGDREADSEPSQADASSPTSHRSAGQEHTGSAQIAYMKGTVLEMSTNQSDDDVEDFEIIDIPLQQGAHESLSGGLTVSEPTREDRTDENVKLSGGTLVAASQPHQMSFEDTNTSELILDQSSSEEHNPVSAEENLTHDGKEKVVPTQESSARLDVNLFGQDPIKDIAEDISSAQVNGEISRTDRTLSDELTTDPITDRAVDSDEKKARYSADVFHRGGTDGGTDTEVPRSDEVVDHEDEINEVSNQLQTEVSKDSAPESDISQPDTSPRDGEIINVPPQAEVKDDVNLTNDAITVDAASEDALGGEKLNINTLNNKPPMEDFENVDALLQESDQLDLQQSLPKIGTQPSDDSEENIASAQDTEVRSDSESLKQRQSHSFEGDVVIPSLEKSGSPVVIDKQQEIFENPGFAHSMAAVTAASREAACMPDEAPDSTTTSQIGAIEQVQEISMEEFDGNELKQGEDLSKESVTEGAVPHLPDVLDFTPKPNSPETPSEMPQTDVLKHKTEPSTDQQHPDTASEVSIKENTHTMDVTHSEMDDIDSIKVPLPHNEKEANIQHSSKMVASESIPEDDFKVMAQSASTLDKTPAETNLEDVSINELELGQTSLEQSLPDIPEEHLKCEDEEELVPAQQHPVAHEIDVTVQNEVQDVDDIASLSQDKIESVRIDAALSEKTPTDVIGKGTLDDGDATINYDDTSHPDTFDSFGEVVGQGELSQQQADRAQTEASERGAPEVDISQPKADIGNEEVISATLLAEIEEAVTQHSSEMVASEPPVEVDDAVMEQDTGTLDSEPFKTELEDLHALMHSSDQLNFKQPPPTIVEHPPSDSEENVEERGEQLDTFVQGQTQNSYSDDIDISSQDKAELRDTGATLPDEPLKDRISDKTQDEDDMIVGDSYTKAHLHSTEGAPAGTSFEEEITLPISRTVEDFSARQPRDVEQLEDPDRLGLSKEIMNTDLDEISRSSENFPDNFATPAGITDDVRNRSNVEEVTSSTLSENDNFLAKDLVEYEHEIPRPLGAHELALHPGSHEANGQPSPTDAVTPVLNQHTGQLNVESSSSSSSSQGEPLVEKESTGSNEELEVSSRLPDIAKSHPFYDTQETLGHCDSNMVVSEPASEAGGVAMEQSISTPHSQPPQQSVPNSKEDMLFKDEMKAVSTEEPSKHSDTGKGEDSLHPMDEMIIPRQDSSKSDSVEESSSLADDIQTNAPSSHANLDEFIDKSISGKTPTDLLDEAIVVKEMVEDQYTAPNYSNTSELKSGSDETQQEPSQKDLVNLTTEHVSDQERANTPQTEKVGGNSPSVINKQVDDEQTTNSATLAEVEEAIVESSSELMDSELSHVSNDMVVKQSMSVSNSEPMNKYLEDLSSSQHSSDEAYLEETTKNIYEHLAKASDNEKTVSSPPAQQAHSDVNTFGETSAFSSDGISLISSQDKSGHIDDKSNKFAVETHISDRGDTESGQLTTDGNSRPANICDSEYPSSSLGEEAERKEISENKEELFKANDLSDDELASYGVYDGKRDVASVVKDQELNVESPIVKRALQDDERPVELPESLNRSIAPSWTGQIVAEDNPLEDWTSDTDYYEEFRLQSSGQDSDPQQHSHESEKQPASAGEHQEDIVESRHAPGTTPSVATESQNRPEPVEDVVAVKTRMTNLAAEKGRVMMTDVSSLMETGSMERPESSAFGTPPEDMLLGPANTPPPHTETAARKDSGPLGVYSASHDTELEKGQVTPETLTADEEEHYDDGAELEYDEPIGGSAWRMCVVGGQEQRIDMTAIEPYTKVLSHGGYIEGDSGQSIVVFAACHLPERGLLDYAYIMDNLFLYVLATLDELVAEEYVLVYLHGGASSASSPTFSWLRRAYQLVDRRLRKTLKGLYLVHPSFWLRTIVALTRPFISSKFSRKLRYVEGLRELSDLIPMNHVMIPEEVKQVDFQLMIAERKKELNIK